LIGQKLADLGWVLTGNYGVKGGAGIFSKFFYLFFELKLWIKTTGELDRTKVYLHIQILGGEAIGLDPQTCWVASVKKIVQLDNNVQN
jgi:hypothetical protein